MNTTSLTSRPNRKRGRRDTIDGDVGSTIRQRTTRSDEEGSRELVYERSRKRLSHEAYTVGWLSALPIELAAARLMLDEIHDDLSGGLLDTNTYTLGKIGEHNVVIACLPSGQYGTNNAAIVATNMKRSFPSIDVRLMVGIGGGVPGQSDIRLGDVVVSTEVLQYDFGKTQDGQLNPTSSPIRPPQSIMTATSKLQSKPLNLLTALSRMLEHQQNATEFTRLDSLNDHLFRSDYEHARNQPDCKYCDQSKLQRRPDRSGNECIIHYGLIASGNQVMRHGKTRDYWSQKNVLCFEMEAAGLMNNFSCAVIRGICDYADSHKNKEWQPHAAALAAVYAKELLSVIPPNTARPWQDIFLEPIEQPLSQGQRQSSTSLTAEQKKSLLLSLRFDQIDARYMTIKTAHARTCKWFLSTSQYIDWLDPVQLNNHYGFLWVKGKPAAGKSTLMKFLRQNAIETIDDTTVINFFFNARGDVLEKSVMGMYRSLLLQLLTQIPTLQTVFDSLKITSWYLDQPTYTYTWTAEILKDLLEKAINDLEGSSVVCFVDALDECDQQDIRDMISYFEHIGDLAISNDIQFRVCFSSRHYPHITVKHGLHSVLEDQAGHDQDIENYVYSELRIGNSSWAQSIRIELKEKASGVFMWVVLVVEILNKEYDDGQTGSLRQRLQEIPGNLHELFREMLSKDASRKQELLLCIQWILFARAPLKPEELYFAILYGMDGGVGPWDKEQVSREAISRFILSISKGLAEITKSWVPTVQFIHESIRDFFLKEEGMHDVSAGLENFEGQSHERLKRCCLSYNGLDISSYWDLNEPLSESSSRLIEAFPFLRYSVNNVLHHAEKSLQHGIPQPGFFDDWNFILWTRFYNIWRKPGFRRYAPNTRIIYVLAEVDTPHLIGMLPSDLECIQPRDEQFKFPLIAAMINESHGAVGVFRWTLARSQSFSNSVQMLLDKNYRCHNRYSQIQTQSALIHSRLVQEFGDTHRRSIISYVVGYGDEGIFASLVEMKYFTSNLKDRDTGLTALSWATIYGHTSVVKILLMDQQVDLNSTDARGRTALWWAAEFNHSEVAKLLLQHESIEFKGSHDDFSSDFCWNHSERFEVFHMLVRAHKIDLNFRDVLGRTPLWWAVSKGQQDIIKMLLDTGADPNSRDKHGQTPLLWATYYRYEKIIKLLLNARAIDLDSRDYDGRTPLSWAASEGWQDIIKMLLDTGADPNSRDKDGRTPLSWAASKGQESIIKMLLDTGADPNLRDTYGRGPISLAVYARYEGIVELLLNAGARFKR